MIALTELTHLSTLTGHVSVRRHQSIRVIILSALLRAAAWNLRFSIPEAESLDRQKMSRPLIFRAGRSKDSLDEEMLRPSSMGGAHLRIFGLQQGFNLR